MKLNFKVMSRNERVSGDNRQAVITLHPTDGEGNLVSAAPMEGDVSETDPAALKVKHDGNIITLTLTGSKENISMLQTGSVVELDVIEVVGV